MELDNLSGLPDWDDEHFKNLEEEGDSWKRKEKNKLAAKLYNQWKQVLVLLLGLYDSIKPSDEEEGEESFFESQKGIILSDAYLVGAKIRGAEAGDMYVLRMENASMIRTAAQTVYIHMSSLKFQGLAEETHTDAVRSEIEIFREYFKEWVTSFKKDEFEDEWGLFK
ncbi:MAG TPA: hypothetical protein VKT28_09030 [Puia sp.]|nr:hypothetical protein [Puia sp.]